MARQKTRVPLRAPCGILSRALKKPEPAALHGRAV